MKTPRAFIAAVAVLGLVAAGCGSDDDNDASSDTDARTVEIEMRDTAFSPDHIDVDRGETIRFVFHNTGAAVHDAFIGDDDAQNDHEIEMRDQDDSDMGHGDISHDEGGITVDPGDTGKMTHTFTEAGTVLVGCHQPGHYAGGMKFDGERHLTASASRLSSVRRA